MDIPHGGPYRSLNITDLKQKQKLRIRGDHQSEAMKGADPKPAITQVPKHIAAA